MIALYIQLVDILLFVSWPSRSPYAHFAIVAGIHTCVTDWCFCRYLPGMHVASLNDVCRMSWCLATLAVTFVCWVCVGCVAWYRLACLPPQSLAETCRYAGAPVPPCDCSHTSHVGLCHDSA